MGGACCALGTDDSTRVEFVTRHLTADERTGLAEIFGTEPRPRKELQAQWHKFFSDPFSPATEWAGTWGPASPRCMGGDVTIECWTRYRALAGEVAPECSLSDFEFVTAEVKVVRERRRRDAAQKLKTVLNAKGFRQALLHCVSAVVIQLLKDGHADGKCTMEQLKASLTRNYGVEIPGNMLPCQLRRRDSMTDRNYHSAEFISARELRSEHLLALVDNGLEDHEVDYCCQLQAALQEMYPAELLEVGSWMKVKLAGMVDKLAAVVGQASLLEERMGWLHSQVWSDPQVCVGILNKAMEDESCATAPRDSLYS